MKWFNAISIEVTNVDSDSVALVHLHALPFVGQIKSMATNPSRPKSLAEKSALQTEWPQVKSIASNEVLAESSSTVYSYGEGFGQIAMHNGQLLHEMGFTGKGVIIAQLDAGWTATERLPIFDKAFSEGRILMSRDFVGGPTSSVFNTSTHGTSVLSIMTGYMPDSLVGAAPEASFCLLRTEWAPSESIIEEDNWVAGAELADSLGADIINSSLGYSVFDDSLQNHTYADMNGHTTRCSIAADIAAAKGILVVNSAGNSGTSSWHYLTAPSDGDSVLCIGAVGADSLHAAFSSYGPSSDGDVKPNVVSYGYRTVIASLDSTITRGSGTSFSSPVIAGLSACLVQAFPDKTNMEIFRAIEQSSHMYGHPTDSLGYGIPNFWKAFLILSGNAGIGELDVVLFPNPCTNTLRVGLNDPSIRSVDFSILDAVGKTLLDGNYTVGPENLGYLNFDDVATQLATGIYYLRLESGERRTVVRFEKKN